MPTRCAISWGWPKMRASSRLHQGKSPRQRGRQLLCFAGLGQDRRCVGERRCSDTHVHRVRFGFGTLATPPPNTQVDIALSPPCTTRSDGGRGDREYILHQLQLARTAGRCRRGALSTARVLPAQRDWGFATTVTSTPLIRFWSSPDGTRPGDRGEGHMNRLKRVASLHSEKPASAFWRRWWL